MYRTIRVSSKPIASPAGVAVFLFDKTKTLPVGLGALDAKLGGVLSRAIARSEFSAGKGVVTALYPADAGKPQPLADRAWIVGLGDEGKFTTDTLRHAAARLVRTAFGAKAGSISIHATEALRDRCSAQDAGRAIGEGLSLSNFEFDQFKGAANGGKSDKQLDLTVSADAPGNDGTAIREGLQHGLLVAESANLARNLQATPPNVANPAYIADYAKRMAKQVGLSCDVIDASRAKELGMGGLLAVGSAGSTPPAMIVLEWKGSGRAAKAAPLLLVGKAITFDTGGISLKPADSMDKMKYDKSGGMAVIGAMHAVARLKLNTPVVGIIPCAENMPGQTAYRPGDILTHYNGVTSEILNTDAEGRVVLADALSYGTRKYKPRGVVDLATLTGACVVALGSWCAGCFCSDTAFRKQLFDAGDYSGERLWHLPLWDEHRAAIKGTHGDIINAGGREGGALTAAAFLSFFIEPDGAKQMPKLPWAHLDIAGVADTKKDTGLFATGPTAFGVRLLVRLIESSVNA